ncbi:MAG TPA: hypothetical protein VJ438_02825 [Candidatus Nanoarchaeia archaeon]|nr:hypothetical protein [Candidatus Nanoarchaeia archaeon]
MDINLGNTVPIFAHDVAMSTVTKAKKTKKGNAKKESFTELVFIDAIRKAAIARIMLPMSVLEEMPKMIEENIKKMKKELKDKEMPKEKEKTEIKTTNSSYLG